MRSIILVLAVTACISGRKVDFWKELGISNETMELFKKDLGGIDLEQRYVKLGYLESLAKIANLTKEQEKELKMKKTMIEKPPSEVNSTDISEINEKSGIAHFLYQGDINLSEEQLNELIESANGASKIAGSRVKRTPAMTRVNTWTRGIVYYYFDVNVTSNQAKAASINAAIQLIQARTCIRFVLSNVAVNRTLFTDGQGCHSKLGMVGGEQIISFGGDCDAMGLIAHEIFHALGIGHTHSRDDRDHYVTVDTNAIEPGHLLDFVKYTVFNSINYTPYEYGSMMHYRANCFAKNNTLSMTPVEDDFLDTMGHIMMSFYDTKTLNDHYGCSARCPPSSSANCQNGGVPNPNDCTKCICPLGYGGDLCDQMPPPSGGCGAELTATPIWQSQSFSLGESTKQERNDFTECHHWIKAPAGSKIEVRIRRMKNEMCRYGCTLNGIEFKLKDQQMTNPKICCRDFLSVIFTSELNPLPVIAHNRYKISKFKIQYRIAPVTVSPHTTHFSTTTYPVTVSPPTTHFSTTTCPPGSRKRGCCCCFIV